MDINQLIQQAMDAGKVGDRAKAKQLLSQVIKQDPHSARAWYMLSQVVDEESQIVYCLQKVLAIQPDNQRARARLEQLTDPLPLPVQVAPVVPDSIAPPAPAKVAKKNNHIPAIAAIVTVLCLCSWLWGSSGGSSEPRPTEEADNSDAFHACEQFITNRLKSPKTAEFPWSGDAKIIRTGNNFKVRSYVDSQNGFGALIRTYFVCTVECENSDMCRLIEVNFIE